MTAAGAESAAGAAGSTSTSNAAAGAASNTSASSSQLLVEELWKPGKELRPVFEAVAAPHDALYTAVVGALLACKVQI